uniref:Transcription factor protein n=1 Tax=Ciona intestinalis TaxID=7719 RepID=Q4H3D9_CIOIN|nr:transcription factor Ci-HMG20 [Ciona intestinalis]BAE06488.1 transcription factor protein [Ciona intestinalis]|eukprot:XP_026693947.1 high mobility group protein 20A [Ciona intestinalis]
MLRASPSMEKEDAGESTARKRGWPKGKKRKKFVKDENAPKKPLSGYVRFMNSRRDQVLQENRSLSFADITKLLGEEWTNMSLSEKSIYLDIAEKEKEKYWKEVEAYQRTDAYKVFVKKVNEEKQAQKQAASNSSSKALSETEKPKVNNVSSSIPIFTNEFLEHNKAKETELHQLNKNNTELEQQNAILETHATNLRNAITKLDDETKSLSNKNEDVQENLNKLRKHLVNTFSTGVPATLGTPNMENIDDYISDVCGFLQRSLYNDNETAASIHKVMSNLDPGILELISTVSK